MQPSTISSIRTPSCMFVWEGKEIKQKLPRLQRQKAWNFVSLVTHHKLLLVASHAGAPLGVLVGPDEQLDQTGNGSLLPQSTVVGWA